jgi:hypothetical protein
MTGHVTKRRHNKRPRASHRADPTKGGRVLRRGSQPSPQAGSPPTVSHTAGRTDGPNQIAITGPNGAYAARASRRVQPSSGSRPSARNPTVDSQAERHRRCVGSLTRCGTPMEPREMRATDRRSMWRRTDPPNGSFKPMPRQVVSKSVVSTEPPVRTPSSWSETLVLQGSN